LFSKQPLLELELVQSSYEHNYLFQTNWDYSYFSAEGPDTLSVGKTGVWKVTAQIFDQYYDLFIDVFILEPESEFLSIDSISVTTIGKYGFRLGMHYLLLCTSVIVM